MRKIILFTAFIGLVLSTNAQEECDTLKWKTIESYYCEQTMGTIKKIDYLDGAIINVDTLSVFYPGIGIVNISNDTFYDNEGFSIVAICLVYADIGLIGGWNSSKYYFFGKKFFPNDTIRAGIEIKADLQFMLNQIKDTKGIDIEEIRYWEMIIGVGYTDKDGDYSDSVFYAGADTSIFYVVRTPVGIVGANNYSPLRSVFPNPTRSHFTVTNTENANLYLYNMVGQEVWRAYNTDVETHCNVSLPQGMYVLKVEKDGVFSIHKIVVSY